MNFKNYDNNSPNSAPGLGLQSLSGYGQRGQLLLPEVRNIWYNNQDIPLDGWKFVSCRMDNCRLMLQSGNFVIENCFIDEHTKVYYQNDSVRIIQLFNRSNQWLRDNVPAFAAKMNPDGTISIGV